MLNEAAAWLLGSCWEHRDIHIYSVRAVAAHTCRIFCWLINPGKKNWTLVQNRKSLFSNSYTRAGLLNFMAPGALMWAKGQGHSGNRTGVRHGCWAALRPKGDPYVCNKASFTSVGPEQSHRVPCLEESSACFNARFKILNIFEEGAHLSFALDPANYAASLAQHTDNPGEQLCFRALKTC